VTLAPTGALVREAAAARHAVAAFNVITLEHAEAVAAGAEAAAAPVILQISENAVRHHGGDPAPLAHACAAIARAARTPVALHLDHVTDDALLTRAADCGFSSVMVDAARLPYEDNVAATRAAARWAHERGLWVEAELGRVGGKDGGGPLDPHAPGARTDPAEAHVFVAATGVDSLAVAVGSSHAMTTRTARLDFALLARLRDAAGVPLVLHGSSGVPDGQLARAVATGITKVNVGTALNAALTGAVRARLASGTGVDPRPYLAAGREAMTATVTRLITALTPVAA
jgi:fructose-bisphosphate aldolase class II